jgi:hypothetical protein
VSIHDPYQPHPQQHICCFSLLLSHPICKFRHWRVLQQAGGKGARLTHHQRIDVCCGVGAEAAQHGRLGVGAGCHVGEDLQNN